MMRAHLQTAVIPRFAQSLGAPEANIAAAFAHLIGLPLSDSLLGIRQLNRLNEDDLVALVAPVLGQYFTPEN